MSQYTQETRSLARFLAQHGWKPIYVRHEERVHVANESEYVDEATACDECYVVWEHESGERAKTFHVLGNGERELVCDMIKLKKCCEERHTDFCELINDWSL